ncbi:MAG TPA: VOC family protein [Solirubrobacteraceae bacterium]|jgi:catechol-2,3-dioxygenase|nr:VOC family protein [Solirubrobacteraceae bacterium]
MSGVDLDEGRPRRAALHHVNLKTLRLGELIDWYGQVLGMTPNFQFPGGAFLTNDDANHRIALISLPDFKDDEGKLHHTGMHHSAFEFATLDDLLATYLRLKGGGIVPCGCLDHGLTTSFYYADPDENCVELQVDNYGDWAQSTEFIRTDPRFAEDPIGKPVDPDAIVAARRAGATPQEIHERAYAGEWPPTGAFDLRLPLPG